MTIADLKHSEPLDILDEAEFQLTAAADHLGWSVALGKAIAADATAGGHNVKKLVELLRFLDDTSFCHVSDAAEEFGKAGAFLRQKQQGSDKRPGMEGAQ